MVGGKTLSLLQIENEQIREKFEEPRIHWALVCAAIGCPPLRNEAYTAAKLEMQLEEQAQRVVKRGTRWYQVPLVETPPGQEEGAPDGDTLWVTPIFDWYAGDFEQFHKTLPEYIANYDDAVKNGLALEDVPKVSFLEYDWMRNSQANADRAANAAEAAMPKPDDEQADETNDQTAGDTDGQ